jgi:hypothetical protein
MEEKPRPSTPIPPDRFSTLVPSSRASPPKTAPPKPVKKHYTITVRRKDRSGRWNQVATWAVITDEEDMAGPLAMGLKSNYQIIIASGPPPLPEDSPDAEAQ